MAGVNLPSWSEISQASDGLQLTSTTATWENILARLARIESRLLEHGHRAASTRPPSRPEPDPPDGPLLYAVAQRQFQIPYYQLPPPFIAQRRPKTCWDPPSSRMLSEFPQYDQPPTRPNSCWDPPDGHAFYHQHGYQNWRPSSPPEYPIPRSGFMAPDYYSPPVGQ